MLVYVFTRIKIVNLWVSFEKSLGEFVLFLNLSARIKGAPEQVTELNQQTGTNKFNT